MILEEVAAVVVGAPFEFIAAVAVVGALLAFLTWVLLEITDD